MSINNIIWCQLGDCNKKTCHNCFPVKDCSYNHEFCTKYGICDEIKEDKSKEKVILITGSCGFIGFHLTKKLLLQGYKIIGIDFHDSYIYDSTYKINNSKELKKFEKYKEYNENILDRNHILENSPIIVIHLAAYANVRKSFENPDRYIRNNIECTCKILEQIRNSKNPPLLLYASSSSVYGTNTNIPFQEDDSLFNIESPYAFSKKTCEEYVNLYCKKYKLKAIGFRFFTVYGPGGRPDMAIFNFLKKISMNESIELFGDGSMERDFTYVLDIVDGIYNSMKLILYDGEHKIYNLGNNKPIQISRIVSICEDVVGKKAIIIKKPIPIGDVPITYANIDKARNDFGYNPQVTIENGIHEMYNWITRCI